MEISVSFLFLICVVSKAQYIDKPFKQNNSTVRYSNRNSKCNLTLGDFLKIKHDSFMARFINCNHVDYLLSAGADQTMVLKLKMDVEKILKIKEDIVLFELFDNPSLSFPFSIVSRKDFNDPGEIIKILRPQGICPSDQLKCFGEEDCYDKQSKCDGVWDCLENGEDELNCAGCSNLYKCQNKSTSETLCYQFSDRCNGRPMCMNGDDQRNCNKKQCNAMNDAFLCKNRKCIRSNWVCDSIDDCHDNSDESFCPNSGSSHGTVIAATGSVSCLVLSFIIIWFSCKLYLLKKRRMRERAAMSRGDDALIGVSQQDERDWWEFFFRSSGQSGLACHHGQHVSPITEVQNEIFSRLSAPPPYPIAMATSRSFDEVVAEEMAQRIAQGSGEHSDEELLNPGDALARPPDASDDDSLLADLPPSEGRRIGNTSSGDDRKRNAKVNKSVQRNAGTRIYEDEPPTFEEAMGGACDRGSTNQADLNSSDNDSCRVPPSYSSLFPSQDDDAADETQISENPIVSGRAPTSRFSFLKTLATLKSMFSRLRNRSNSSSLTELIDGQDEFSARGFDCSDIQRIVVTRASAQNSRSEELRIQRWLNQSMSDEPAGSIQWDSDRPSGRHGDQMRFSSGNRHHQHQLQQQQGALPELGRVRNWAFSSDGIYDGDYNVEIATDSDNEEKDDI